MQKFDITHINSYFIASPLHGELLSALDKKGIQQNVFVPVQYTEHVKRNLPKNLINSNVCYSNCFNAFHRYLWPLKMHRVWRSFKKHYGEHPTQLIHAHTLMANGLIAYWAYKKWGTPYLVTVRNTDLNDFLKKLPFLKPLALKVLNHASHVVLISPAYRDEQLNKYFPNEKHPGIYQKCNIVSNGINDFWIKSRKPKEHRQNAPTLLYSGLIDKNKNLASVLEACRLLSLSSYGIKLNVLGDGPLLSVIKNKQYSFPVSFHGHISDKTQILNIMRQSDVLVVPSFKESFGLVYPEAMSQGLPVVYTRGQGFDGYYPDGHVGYAVNPQSPHDIAEKIKLIYKDYDRISENAYNESSQFSWNNVSNKLIGLYENVLTQPEKH